MRFSDALDRKMEEIQRPPNLPIGHYIWSVSKLPDMDEFEGRSGDTFERLTFQLTCVSAHDDVDPDELEAYGNCAGALQRKTFLFTNNADEKANFKVQLRDLTSAMPGDQSVCAYERALLALGDRDAAVYSLQLLTNIALVHAEGVENGPMAEAAAFTLGDESLRAEFAAFSCS